jgi:hypothetical protein
VVPVKSGSCGRVATVAPGWAKRVPNGDRLAGQIFSRVDLPAPLRPTRQTLAGRDAELDAVEDGLVAQVVAMPARARRMDLPWSRYMAELSTRRG